MTGPAEDAEGTGESTPAGSQHYVESSQHNAPVLADAELLAIAAPATGKILDSIFAGDR